MAVAVGSGKGGGGLRAPRIQPVHESVRNLLSELATRGAACGGAIEALCRDRAAEFATLPEPAASVLVKHSMEVVLRVAASSDEAAQVDALASLQHLLTCPSLRKVAGATSRKTSLALLTIEAAAKIKRELPLIDAAASAVLRRLHDAGVGIAPAGALDSTTTPLIAAVRRSFVGAAQVLLDAGADINGHAADGSDWPLSAAARSGSDAGMAWLLGHGASLAVVNRERRTIAHVLAMAEHPIPAGATLPSGEFRTRWLRRTVAAEPRLLETREGQRRTPLMLAAGSTCEAGVAALLELGADIGAVDAGFAPALGYAAKAMSLPVVRQLIAAGAASAAVLPPGSLQARTVAYAAASAALRADRGCGICAARCGSKFPGDCSEGVDILRAVLAAGMREAVGADGHSLGALVTFWLRRFDPAFTVGAEHALTVLQVMHAGGVDVLAQGPADTEPVLHSATLANAPAVVRWLVIEAGARVEERDSESYTPLLAACSKGMWAAAHALLDCGARVDVHVEGTELERWWPVLRVASNADCNTALLKRMLAADPDSLLRSIAGLTLMHLAATNNSLLTLLLGSGLPHLAEAINAVATHEGVRSTPLHIACRTAHWDAALAFLAAGARVDIAGHIGSKAQTIAEWADGSSACKHRGVKLAIAARAREHAAPASAVARSLSRAAAAAATGGAAVATASGASGVTAGFESESDSDDSSAYAGAGAAVAAAARPAGGKKKKPKKKQQQQAKGRKGPRAGARNRAEEAGIDDDAAAPAAGAPHTAAAGIAAAVAAAPSPLSASGSAASGTSVAAVAAAAAVNTCEEGPATLNTCEEGPAALNTCEDGSAAADTGGASSLQASELSAPALNLPEDPSVLSAGSSGGDHALVTGVGAASLNTCEPGPGSASD